MFTGIIENVGVIRKIIHADSNVTFWIESPLSESLKIDQSLSHNGVCLTVEELSPPLYRVTAIAETIGKSNLGMLTVGEQVNLERCMPLNGRLDGHIVQGHVEALGECLWVKQAAGSWEFRFQFPDSYSALVVEKGSICLNGISLTIFNVSVNEFTVAIIPYTYEHTSMNSIKKGDKVNLEFDIIGKYVQRILSLKNY